MEMSPAAGKILGMLMAYAVSSLGLLLAYINYRKRVVGADTLFSRRAKIIITAVVSIAVIGAVLTAAAASSDAGGLWAAVAENPVGVALPVLIVLISVILTWLLYHHFARQMSAPGGSDGGGPE